MCLQLTVTNRHQLPKTKGIPETWDFSADTEKVLRKPRQVGDSD